MRFSKKTVGLLLAALLLTQSVPVVTAQSDNAIVALADANTLTYYGDDITFSGITVEGQNDSLGGELISGLNGGVTAVLLDGDVTTYVNAGTNVNEHEDGTFDALPLNYWVGIDTNGSYVPTKVRIASYTGVTDTLQDLHIQGSVDGTNWEDLVAFTQADYYAYADAYATNPYWEADISTITAYRYFRAIKNNNNTTRNRIAELEIYGVMDEHTHAMAYTAAVDATCATAGSVEYYYCAGCDKYFSDEAGTTELTTLETAINPDNHAGGTEIRDAVDATADSEGYTGDTYCLGCDAKIADGTTIPATGTPETDPVDPEPLPNTIDTYNGTINYSGEYATSVGGCASGEVISGGVDYAAVSAAFDGDMTTQASFDTNYGTDVSYWMGLYFEEAIVPTQFKLAASSYSNQSKIIGSYIQASKDGINWVTLKEYDSGDQWREYATPAEGGYWTTGEYKVVPVETTEAYNYFRYFNYNDQGANRLTEFQVIASDAKINDRYTFSGDIIYTGVDAISVAGSLVGEVIGAGTGVTAEELVKAFDGDLGTTAVIPNNYGDDVSNWMGLKFAAPVTVMEIMLSVTPHHRIMNSYIQGSNDGINWTDIKVLSDWKEYATPEEGGNWEASAPYKMMSFMIDETYTYIRYFNYNDGGANQMAEFLVTGTMDEVVPDYLIGDLNNDGKVTIDDAILLFQHSLMPDLYPIDYPANYDFVEDGKCNIKDALYLFQYSLMPDKYPIA